MSNKIYCKGLLCEKYQRTKKCMICGVFVCGECSIPIQKQRICIDCYVSEVMPFTQKDINISDNPIPQSY